jgi:CBS domain-containing protein
MQVKDIVKPAVIISETDTFASALTALTNEHTNTLLVVDKHGVLTGEVTVTDLLDAVIPDTLSGNEVMSHFINDEAFIASIDVVKDLPVAEFMSRDFTTLTLKDNLATIIASAITNVRARLPVVDDDQHPIGIISRQGLKQILNNFMQAGNK